MAVIINEFGNFYREGDDPVFGNAEINTLTVNTTFAGDAFLDEDDMASDSATKVSSQQSVKAYSNNQHALERSKFIYSSVSAILMDSASYFHSGTKEQQVFWNSQLTFTFGSGGSNSDSDDLTASAFHYLYIDDSAVVTLGTNLLTAAEFRNETTAPTYNQSKHGWYIGNDMCIGAFFSTGASALEIFQHNGDCLIFDDWLGNHQDLADSTDVDTSFVPVTCSVPVLGENLHVYVTLIATGDNNDGIFYVQAGNGTDTTNEVGQLNNTITTLRIAMFRISVNSSQVMRVRYQGSNTGTIGVRSNGWFFPKGM